MLKNKKFWFGLITTILQLIVAANDPNPDKTNYAPGILGTGGITVATAVDKKKED